ncbi:MAG: dihydropteroate synthase [Chloroflexi bacterium]|nr:dihydropteroate synthase [Chloroflexota bacterium]
MITTLSGIKAKVDISPEGPTVIIGERINPTGRSKLTAALEQKDWDVIRQEAVLQVEQGATVIDVNVGAAGIDEVALLPQAVEVVSEATGVPICIDTSNPRALEAALKICGGRPLINSTTGEEASMSVILPLAKKYGAAVIGLCQDERGIAHEPELRLEIAQKIVERAKSYGLEDSDVLIDPLVLTVAAETKAGMVTLTTVRMISEKLGLNMTMGTSNVSFGLPNRYLINNNFLAMAIWCGVTAPVVNPGAKELVETLMAADLVMGKDEYASRYLKHYRKTLRQSQS